MLFSFNRGYQSTIWYDHVISTMKSAVFACTILCRMHTVCEKIFPNESSLLCFQNFGSSVLRSISDNISAPMLRTLTHISKKKIFTSIRNSSRHVIHKERYCVNFWYYKTTVSVSVINYRMNRDSRDQEQIPFSLDFGNSLDSSIL